MSRLGLFPGLAIGPLAELGAAADAMAGVAKDATSNIYCPASDAQWTTTMAAAGLATGNPTSVWLCQEASGNLADSIAANTLTAFAMPGYSQAAAGWTRVGVGFPDGSTAAFYNLSVGNTTTTSVLMLAYTASDALPVLGVDTQSMGTSTAMRRTQITTVTRRYQVVGAGGQATGTGASDPGTAVRPVVMQIDRTAAAIRVATDQEVIAPAYTAPAGGGASLQLGDSGGAACAHTTVYLAYFAGAAAELTQAQIKTLLQTLGWTIPWS